MPARYKEGFQTAPAAAPALVQQCPAAAIKSFPVALGVTANDILYDSVSEPVSIDFQWATRSTPPQFLFPNTTRGLIDEVGAENASRTTLRYRGKSYTIESVQLTAPTHSSWVIPTASRTDNKADMIITFMTNGDTITYKYLTFVIPLIVTAGAQNPDYLRGLAAPDAGGAQFPLRSLFPTESTSVFAYYSTCLKGYSTQKSPENVTVFVATTGVPVTEDLLTAIAGKMSITDRSGTRTYPNYEAPFMSRLEAATKTLTSDFTQYVMTTNQLLNYERASSVFRDMTRNYEDQSIDAYKCVPLDPDSNIEDGKIRVDLDTGKVLTDVMKEREAARAADNVKGAMEPGRLEKYMGSALGIFLAILLFSAIIYFIFYWFTSGKSSATVVPMVAAAAAAAGSAAAPGEPPPPPAQPSTTSWMQSVAVIGFLTLIAGFIGFVIGAMLS